MLLRSFPLLVALIGCLGSGGCFTSGRYERSVVRELSLHAYDEGMRFAEDGNHDIAIDRFVRSTIIRPSAMAYFQLGRTYERLEDPDEAAVSYLQALELAPDFQEARFALMALGFEAPSEAEIKTDPERLPMFAEALTEEVDFRRIEAEQNAAGMTDEERAEMREQIRMRMALASEQRMPTAAEVSAILFDGEGGDIPSATDPTFETDRSIILNTYAYHFANGQRFQRNREYEKAVTEYTLALNAEPDEMEARLNLGDALLRLERYPQASFHYTRSLELFPESPRPLLKMGNYYDSLNRPDLARSFFTRSLDKDPGYVEALNNMAAIEIREHNYEQAIALLQSITEIDPNYELAFLNLGVARENAGQPEAALEAYRRYVELGGEQSPEVRKWIAELE